jgi:alkyldihydroxyacetonephosphate synthase
MVDHRSADPASPRRLRRMHGLQLGVVLIKPLQRAHAEDLTVDAEAEERNGRIDEAVNVKRVHVLGRAMRIGEIEVTLQQFANVLGPRVVNRDLASRHFRNLRDPMAPIRAPGWTPSGLASPVMADPGSTRRRSWWGWGWEDQAIGGEQLTKLGKAFAATAGGGQVELRRPPRLDELELRPPRLSPPDSLTKCCSVDAYSRAAHTHGRSFADVVRAVHGDFAAPPDVVAFPRNEEETSAVLDWCASIGAAAVPYGGGSSVVGGVSCDVGDDYRGAVSIDLGRLDRVLEVDRVSRAARIQAGVLGPALEDQLRPHGYTLRHFPQSFEFSSLGGWLATRSGGHYATNYTHIDDFVESLRVLTPAGVVESRRLPGSGAGPSPDRLFLGSEGILGIITEAWMRLQDRPVYRASASVHFRTMADGAAAARAVAQAALFPANCRLLDAGEAATSAGVADGSALLVLGFESADHSVDAWMARAVELCSEHGGVVPDGVRSSSTEGAAGAWRESFLRAPYGRDALVQLGGIAETFETSCTWDRFDDLHHNVTDSVSHALREVCGGGTLTCRFTHVYPDGPAPYYTIVAPSRHGDQLSQWSDIKEAASEAVLANGGTITHHHAVGRDHRRWYDQQRPPLFAETLRAAKGALDPAWVLNPGVLIGR